MRDDESGLYYNWHRCYNPRFGRYYQADPIGLEGGGNLYAYAGNNPLYFIDPFGLSIGEPGAFESMIPVWGSARQAINDFQTGHPFWGAVNTVAAASDVFLIGGLIRSVGKVGVKGVWKMTNPRGRLGGHSWGATKNWYYQTRSKTEGHELHHWLFEQNRGISKHIPLWIKNQPWNVMQMPSDLHRLLDKKDGLSQLAKMWKGSPTWSKFFGVSINAREVEGFRNDYDCR